MGPGGEGQWRGLGTLAGDPLFSSPLRDSWRPKYSWRPKVAELYFVMKIVVAISGPTKCSDSQSIDYCTRHQRTAPRQLGGGLLLAARGPMYWSPAHPFLLNYLLAYLGTCMGTWPAEQTTNFSTEPAHEPAPLLVHPRHFDPGAGHGGMQRGRQSTPVPHLVRCTARVPGCVFKSEGMVVNSRTPLLFPHRKVGFGPA